MFCRSVYILALFMHHQPKSRAACMRTFLPAALDYLEAVDEIEQQLLASNRAAAVAAGSLSPPLASSPKRFDNGLASGESGGAAAWQRTHSRRRDAELIALRVWVCLGLSQLICHDSDDRAAVYVRHACRAFARVCGCAVYVGFNGSAPSKPLGWLTCLSP